MHKIQHVLLIDDDPIINMINTRIIQVSKKVIQVSSVTSGEEALMRLKEIISNDPMLFPQFIFLDINMPGVDGWEFLSELSSFSRSVLALCKIVVLSSSIDLFDIKKAKKIAIVDDYLIKPLDLEKLGLVLSPTHQPFSISQGTINIAGL